MALAVTIALFVAADWQGWLGVREEYSADYVHLNFRFVDAESRRAISDVHIACTRPGQLSACSERQGPGAGITTITFAARKMHKRGVLFSEYVGHTFGRNGVMHLQFIHPDYARAGFELDDAALAAIHGPPRVITLSRAQ